MYTPHQTLALKRAEAINTSIKEIDFDKYSMICIPEDVRNSQHAEMFVKYMNDHPEKLHQDAFTLFPKMLLTYFPCKAK